MDAGKLHNAGRYIACETWVDSAHIQCGRRRGRRTDSPIHENDIQTRAVGMRRILEKIWIFHTPFLLASPAISS